MCVQGRWGSALFADDPSRASGSNCRHIHGHRASDVKVAAILYVLRRGPHGMRGWTRAFGIIKRGGMSPETPTPTKIRRTNVFDLFCLSSEAGLNLLLRSTLENDAHNHHQTR